MYSWVAIIAAFISVVYDINRSNRFSDEDTLTVYYHYVSHVSGTLIIKVLRYYSYSHLCV